MSTSASSSATAETPNQPTKPLPPPSRRRDKPQLSCNLCRKRKLKCDRGQPCETCVKRGLSLSCTYVNPSNVAERSEKSQLRTAVFLDMQDRISQLEKLVKSQIGYSSADAAPDDTLSHPKGILDFDQSLSGHLENEETLSRDSSKLSGQLGRITVDDAGTSYVDNAHWTAVLDGIGELKDFLKAPEVDQYDLPDPEVSNTDGPGLLLGDFKHARREEIIMAMPSRPIVDRLISKCFDSVEIAPVIIHSPTFLKEYERFWDHPQETSILWIGLLFGMMCLAVLYEEPTPDSSNEVLGDTGRKPDRLIQTYREKIVQCLILGRYTDAAPYTIEALLLYMHVEYLQSVDTPNGLWILLGIVIRLALRMGYHRDTANFPIISPFHAEMRRRVWSVVSMLDATTSAQFGLPRMIHTSQSNTAEPRNLLDEDMHENMTEIPLARPETIQTHVQYFVAKNRLVSAFGKIADLTTLTKPPHYAEILRIDGILHEANDSIPPWLTMRPMTKSIMDSQAVIIQRVYVALIFFKAKCVLHRTYLLPARSDRRYTYSRTACIEAALEILRIQQILDQETRPGGRLHRDRGPVSSFVKSDFLLATTIMCVDVNQTIKQASLSESHNTSATAEPLDDVINILYDTYQIWLKSSETSREAQQAARVLKIVFEKLDSLKMKQSTSQARIVASTSSSGNGLNFSRANTGVPSPEQPASATAGRKSFNPMFLPDLSVPDKETFPDVSEMSFEMGNWWETKPQSDAHPSHMTDSDARQFGWILPGGGQYDAF